MSHGPAVSDKTLLRTVLQRMTHKGTGSNRISATVSSGDVTIAGTIANEYERRPILRSVSNIQGVRRVLDHLTVVARKKPEN